MPCLHAVNVDIIDIIMIMTLYHKVISRTTGEWTGKMRQCSSDPCPVHPAGSHFHANSAKDAELMALEQHNKELIKQAIAEDHGLANADSHSNEPANNTDSIDNEPNDDIVNGHDVKGNYQIYCSPFDNDDNKFIKSMKRDSFISDAKQAGMYFVSSATIINNGGMKRDGMVFECNITDRTSFDYMMNKLHELADTYDDGTGFYVFREVKDNENSNDIMTTFGKGYDKICESIGKIQCKGYDIDNQFIMLNSKYNKPYADFMKQIMPYSDSMVIGAVIKKGNNYG